MERTSKWLDVALVVLKALVVLVSALTADQALTGGQLARVVQRPVAEALGDPLPPEPLGSSWKSFSPVLFEPVRPSVWEKKSLHSLA